MPPVIPGLSVKLVDACLQNHAGERVDNVEQGHPIALEVVLEARGEVHEPSFSIGFLNDGGDPIFSFHRSLADGSERLQDGQRVRISGKVENPLLPGRYSIGCFVSQSRSRGDTDLHVLRLLEFAVFGTGHGPGSVAVTGSMEAVAEPLVEP